MSTKVKSSLLFLTQTLADLKHNAKYLLEESFKKTNENLYIYINPTITNTNNLQLTYLSNDRMQLKLILNQFYQNSFKLNPNVNVTCLLSNIHQLESASRQPHTLSYDLILTDYLIKSDESTTELSHFLNSIIVNTSQTKSIAYHTINCENKLHQINYELKSSNENDLIALNKTYDNTIMGGTFDRLHNGHKLMLSEAVLLTRHKLLIGTTSESMLKKKKLAELIQPYEVRCELVKKFLKEVYPHLEVLTPLLIDPFGPSITEKDYQCLVVSRETFKTGEMVNTKRTENNLPVLDIHMIEMMSEDRDTTESDNGDEEKISSSNERRRLLGSLLRPPYEPYDPSKPYVIGLTGGLASGKSNIRADLEKLGAGTVDCDKLGHRTYEINTNAYKKIVEQFGSDILNRETLEIDRKKLGEKVFQKPDELKQLTDIVWPEIRKLLNLEIEKLFREGKRIIVVEAALLLDANWDSGMNEVWVCFVPDDEAITRSVKRDNSNLEKVKSILNSQMSNVDRLKRANVVFSSLWEREYTIKQVNKAWKLLQERINEKL